MGSPCPLAPPLHQRGQQPQLPLPLLAPWPHGPCALQGNARVFRDQAALPWVLFLQWGRVPPEPLFLFGGVSQGSLNKQLCSGKSGPTGVAPSTACCTWQQGRRKGPPDPGTGDTLVPCGIQAQDPPRLGGPGSNSGCLGWGRPRARTRMGALRRAGPACSQGRGLREGHSGPGRDSVSGTLAERGAAPLSRKHQQRRQARGSRAVLTDLADRALCPPCGPSDEGRQLSPGGLEGRGCLGAGGPWLCPGRRVPQKPPCARRSCMSGVAI